LPVGFWPIRDATILPSGALAGMLSALVAVAFEAVHARAPSDPLNGTGELLRIYGPRIGAIAIAEGALGVLCGVMHALSGRLTALSYLVLLTLLLALFTIWLTAASFLLWRTAEGRFR
jgi:hypothetical protein